MKLQPASQKELARIAAGTLAGAAVMVAVFALLGVLGVYPFRWTVLTGAAGGCAVAILNFALLCLTVQNAAGIQDPKLLRAKVQASYTARLLVQGLWCLVAYLAPCFQVVAGILPLFFPNLVIYSLRAAGKIDAQPGGTNPQNQER
ncbi:MAG: ATP synthase subunit I [Gemmiger sp.]